MWSLFEPKYLKAVLKFSNYNKAYFSDLRNFATFKFSNNKEDLDKKLASLGSDFLKTDVDISKITKYKSPIVKLLMDQKKIGSGLGNYLVAEILYRAKISPHRLGNSLTKSELNKLNTSIRYTVKLSYIYNNIGYMVNFEDEAEKIKKIDYHPNIILNPKDDQFEFLVYRQKYDPKGNPVHADSIIKGRTTYWVPAIQK